MGFGGEWSAKTPPGCIFCRRLPLTKEHVFGKRLWAHIPRVNDRTNHIATMNTPDSNEIDRGKLDRPGDLISQTLKVVYGGCNNGWMSRLQSDSFADVVKLIRGDWGSLTRDASVRLSKVMALTAMVSEFSDPATVAIPHEDREYFRKEQEIPPGWYILIGGYSDKLERSVAFNHFGGRFFEENPPLGTREYSFSTNGFAIGGLVVQIMVSKSPLFEQVSLQMERLFCLRSLYPYRGIIRRPEFTHNYYGFDKISSYFADIFGLSVESFVRNRE